jgi:hypothetical protein
MIRTHWGQHAAGCFGCKIATVQFGQAMNIATSTPPQRKTEHLFGADRDAYYRLRQNGLQPKSIRNCAELEAVAEIPREVEEGRRISKQAWREAGGMLQEAEAIVRECSTEPNSDQAKEVGERFRDFAREEGLVAPAS